MINNAVVRSTKPEVLALMKPPDDSLPSASRLRRWWRRAYVRVRVVAVFLHVSDNEVKSSLPPTFHASRPPCRTPAQRLG